VTTTPSTAEAGPGALAGRAIPALFTLTIFTSAALLFFVQPLFTRIALPQIGGAPAVWTTAMLFFQTALIAGYVYAHLLVRHVPVRIGLALHLALWAAALLFLPLALPAGWGYDPEGSAAWQTLVLYALGVGVPFTFLSANAPLIQAWYARSGGPSAADPYFLYGASNLGSLAALLAFPLAAEPLFGLGQIGRAWAWGFAALGVLLLLSGLAARDRAAAHAAAGTSAGTSARPGARRIGAWLFLAFVPSSLMLGVTSKISTDIGSFPLVWVVPLALYLLTFVLAFTNRPPVGERTQRALLVASLVFLAVMVSLPKALLLTWTIAGILILAFFGVALAAHARLYALRPDREHLTTFYVVMSVGGALGGLFNSLVAPVVFDQIHELRVTVALAAVLLVAPATRFRPVEAAIGIVAAQAAVLPGLLLVKIDPGVKPLIPAALLAVTLAAAVALLGRRGTAPAVALAAVVVSAPLLAPDYVLLRDRSFFGAHTVVNRGAFRVYSNGTTIHGAQFAEDVGAADPRPLTYYHESGPMGQVLASPRGRAAGRIGIVGLGVGALSCYRGEGQDWHFYEIDRKVDEIARNPALFSYMSSCAGDAPTHLGDARIVLAAQTDARFDILVIDAYSSDAVPVHLTTREAIELYRDRLAPGGLVLFHITNRYYDISRPLARAAADLGLAARIQTHIVPPADTSGALSSIVVALAENEAALGELAADPRWQPLPPDGGRVWTDDHANLLGILR